MALRFADRDPIDYARQGATMKMVCLEVKDFACSHVLR